MKLPGNPMNYKTRRGLFNALIRALECPLSVSRAWWIRNAVWYAEQTMPDLLPQMRRVLDEASPKTLDDLIPVGHSRPA